MKQSTLLLVFSLLLVSNSFFAQESNLKQPISEEEAIYLKAIIGMIAESDQEYRTYISANTMDDQIIAQMDSVYEAEGMEAYIEYEKSLNLKMDKNLKDSLWNLQHEIDLQNHLTLRGIFDSYGYLPKTLLKENHYVQFIVLLHPPKDWDIPTYLDDYSDLLMKEVKAGRMEAKEYATFYDNINGKILRKPQLYGTNMVFDSKTNSVMPPPIEDIEKTNIARVEIGLEPLKEGEYTLIEK
ncbi:MAG: hypothetical protein AAFO07_29055 [Bacteroidota bacterium]